LLFQYKFGLTPPQRVDYPVSLWQANEDSLGETHN
jgi:hypothetical protein